VWRGRGFPPTTQWGVAMNAIKVAVVSAIIVCFLLSGTSFAGERKKERRERNRAEPALQSVKTMWRGVKALGYHSLKSFHEGNQKVPVLGSIEVFRGFRRGTVELATSTYKGMAGCKPKPVDKVSKANELIESDTIVRNTADIAGTAIILPIAGATVIWGGQKVVDHKDDIRRELKGEEKAEEDAVASAQQRYLGKRVVVAKKPTFRSDAIALSR
jgi:hypothetical protein